MAHNNDWLGELKSKVDIADIISRYVTLTQKGNTFWGCCPFHKEKTPSFAVNTQRQHYHCFGCKESGDAISFVQKIESLDFMDAVTKIAQTINFEIPQFSKSDHKIHQLKKIKDRIYAILQETAKFYYRNLSDDKSFPQREYMQKRGLDKSTQIAFGLGASLDYHGLPKFLKEQGYTYAEMIESGVCLKKGENIYDALFGRLIFPIIDQLGQVVGFGGRLLEKSDFAKYKNTQSTLVFDKSKVLYGYNLLKKLKQQQELSSLIIVEGYMDTISLHSAGIKNVVASMGTALTDGQIRLLKNIVKKVYVSYDGDTAGAKATIRSLDLLKNAGLDVFVVQMPDGFDPDDIIKKYGADGYLQLVDTALILSDYKMLKIKEKYNLDDNLEKQKYLHECIVFIRSLSSSLEQEEYLKKLKEQTGYTYKSLSDELEKVAEKASPDYVYREEIEIDNGYEKAIRYILLQLIENKKNAKDILDISAHISHEVHRIVFDYVLDCQSKSVAISPNILYDYVSSDKRYELDKIFDMGNVDTLDKTNQQYFEDCVKLFKKRSLENEIEILSQSIDNERDKDLRREMGKKLGHAVIELKKLKD